MYVCVCLFVYLFIKSSFLHYLCNSIYRRKSQYLEGQGQHAKYTQKGPGWELNCFVLLTTVCCLFWTTEHILGWRYFRLDRPGSVHAVLQSVLSGKMLTNLMEKPTVRCMMRNNDFGLIKKNHCYPQTQRCWIK